jgi:hypothetical protein
MKTQTPPEEPGTWKRFVETARHIMLVPKAEIDRREAAYKRRRARLKKQHKPA